MDDKTAIQSEQLRQLFSGSDVSLATSVLLATILAYMQLDAVAFAVVLGWFSLVVLITLLRGALVFAYRRSTTVDEAAVRYWLVRFRLGVLAAAIVWGSAGVLLFPADDPQHQMFLIFMLAGLTAGGVISYSADIVAAIAFSVLVISPMVLRLLGAGDSLSVAMGMAALLYLGFMIMSLRHTSRNIRENIALRLDAAAREAAVRTSEERYRLLLSHSPVGIFHYDADLVVTYCNSSLAGILNSTIESQVGLDMKQLKDMSVLPALKAALAGETGFYEGPYRATFSAADIWIAMTCAPSLDSAGKIEGGIAIVQDITGRKQAEEELRIAATAFETQEGIVITDCDNRILRVNRAFTRLTGYSAEEAIGRTPALLQSGRQDAQFYRDMWLALAQDGYWEGEIWNRRKDGEVYPEWLAISAVRDLDNRVTHYVAVFSDITMRKQDEAKIHNLAFYDHLTQLPNRRLLMDRLNHAMAAASRDHSHGALLFIDLDNFKVLNDTKGHTVGDLLLIEVAQRLQDCMRGGDTVARLGGDEFVVMLEDLSEEPGQAATQADAAGEKIRLALSRPYLFGDFEHSISSSIGISLFRGHDTNIDDLLKRADTAMYEAKNSGRNTLRFFDPAMQSALESRAALETDLRQALQRQQFRLYYQLQVDESNRPIGAEALLRWMHPVRGTVSPLDFIPLAEETALILPIGLWVLETACDQIKAWAVNPQTRELQLAVNVSARQFHQADFVAQVRAALDRTAIDPARLKLELTESVVLDDVGDTIAKMHALKKLGVRFSMDDFGTGYSSLAYLTQLPLDQLKIDQSFVRNLGIQPADAVVVQTIISMGHSLNMEVVAEGVEVAAQHGFLAGLGCHLYQGYLFSRPMPAEDIDQLLRSPQIAPGGGIARTLSE